MKKRLLCILMALVTAISVLSGTLVFSRAADAAGDIVGDVDGDGDVAILDATAIQRYLASLITLDAGALRRALIVSTDETTILDATAIQRYLAGFKDHTRIGQPITDPQPATQAPTVKPTEAPTRPEEPTKVKNNITVYFSNNKNWRTVNAYVFNTGSGHKMAEWPGTPMTYVKTNNEGEKVYSVNVDLADYDRIIFNNGVDQTTDTPITKASSGYFINSKKSSQYNNKFLCGLYPYGQNGEGKVTTVSLDYPEGYKKKVYIWTPEGYNANDKTKKYSVLYMCDGQNLFGQATTLSGYEWECDESVLSLMKNGGDGVIVVGVDNSSNKRDHELTPNLGELAPGVNTYGSFSDGGGKAYSDFMVDTVIPYVENRYNVNSIRGIAGSSSGGIEAFYIGIEHMDKFRYIGALSPAFILYTKAIWTNYLKTKDFSGNVPRIWFYCGNSTQDQLEQQLYPNAVAMQGWLKNFGYPAEKMTTVTDAEATHSESFWALYFPEMLCWGLDV